MGESFFKRLTLQFALAVFIEDFCTPTYIGVFNGEWLSSRELTYHTNGKGNSSSQHFPTTFGGDMLVSKRVIPQTGPRFMTSRIFFSPVKGKSRTKHPIHIRSHLPKLLFSIPRPNHLKPLFVLPYWICEVLHQN